MAQQQQQQKKLKIENFENKTKKNFKIYDYDDLLFSQKKKTKHQMSNNNRDRLYMKTRENKFK